MRSLYWKEWTENRTVIIMSGLLMAVLFYSFVEFYIHSDRLLHDRHYQILPYQFDVLLMFFWCIPAALCSVAMVAPEVGSRTFDFLTSLPLSRMEIWRTKVSTALFVTVCSDLCAWFVFEILIAWIEATHLLPPVRIGQELSFDLGYTLLGLLLSIPVFALGMVVTTLVDNTVTALVTLVGVSVVVIASIFFLDQLLEMDGSIGVMLVAGATLLLLVLCIVCSGHIFVHGKNLRTLNRFALLLLNPLLGDVVLVLAALTISYVWLMN